ncbi:hypothetical protein MACJ_001954 [Theileria orientalis]|uniref:Uncharacterized protein n=1 Tax=Theileria orientalis TaxID=68886 RepID=A0A976QV64_THEOR|nr:hypothetical protein MACJ_001954 [Theileria orientalis]
MENKHNHNESEQHVNTLPGHGVFFPVQSWQRSLAKCSGFITYPHDSDGHEFTLDELNYKFETLVKSDDPTSACNPIKVEEFKCLNSNNYRENPEFASTKCVKWYNEWMQCKWDEQKLKFGYNYIEPRTPRKRKAYIAAPNYQYS